MGSLVLVSEQIVARPAADVFELFGQPGGAGWLFGSRCDRVAPGQVVRFSMPAPDGSEIMATGRIAEVVANRRIVLLQESPWRGRVVISLHPIGPGHGSARVRLHVELDETAVPWLLRSSGCDVADETHDAPETERCVRIGLLVSLSGVAGMLGRAAQNAAELAVAQLNADGGLCGLPVRMCVSDDGTDPRIAAREFVRLADILRCDVVVAMMSSVSMAAIRPLAESRGTLLLYAPVNEGAPERARIFHFGERPADQLTEAIPMLMAETSSRAWFVVGNGYSWPRAVGRAARRIIEQSGGVVLGERYQPLGEQDFTPILDAVAASGAQLVVSAMVGTDAVAFERAFFDSGLRAQTRTIATLMDDVVREHVGDAAATGIWSVLDHFVDLDTPECRALKAQWRERFGAVAPPLSATAKSVYDVTRLYGDAVRHARSTDAGLVAAEMRSSRALRRARVLGRAAGQRRPTCIAEAVPGGFVMRSQPS